MSPKNTYLGFVSSLSADEFDLLASAVAERKCRDSYGFGTFAESADIYRPHPPCPECEFPDTRRDGTTASGLQSYECGACGRKYNSLTGTVLESSKKSMPEWVGFINMMRFGVPLDCIALTCGISHQTAFEWRHRVFESVDVYQSRIVLRDRIWIDETYISDTDLSHGYGEARKRGLSKQLICIAVAIDIHKNPVAVVCGHGKPSTKRMKDALLSHLAPGSLVIHDKERSHTGLIKAAKCTDMAYKADASDPLYIEAMAMVNNLCSWLKRYLWRFTGMDPKNLQLYLDWYVYLYRVNQAKDKWPETARVVRHLLMTDAHYRSPR